MGVPQVGANISLLWHASHIQPKLTTMGFCHRERGTYEEIASLYRCEVGIQTSHYERWLCQST